MNIRSILEERITKALAAAGAPAGSPAMVAPSGKPQFGDYQANGAMSAAKRIKANPRQLAQKVVELLSGGPGAPGCDLSDMAAKVEVAGPGFINIHLKAEWLASRLNEILARAAAGDDKLGVDQASPPQTVVVDYSAPNLAKEMHVGHLRSTIIGDALARVLDFQGHKVIRQNHVGDWGTQFGMLLQYMMERTGYVPDQAVGPLSMLADLEEFYRRAKALYDEDQEFAARARECVVKLQRGDHATKTAWLWFVVESMEHVDAVYKRLGVGLAREHLRGESQYNEDLRHVIFDLQKAGLLEESQDAMVVFPDRNEFKGKDGEPLPFIVQKSDEGYLYATTDLAAIRYRVATLHADRVLYVVDARQSLHFKMLFAVAAKAGFATKPGPEDGLVQLEHIAFGTMMGADGKPFKTRTGGTVKLMDLLDEAVAKARELVEAKNAEDAAKDPSKRLTDEQKKDIAEAVGIGAVKYADLSQNRTSDYVFSWDKMLALDGNTAPYMQYAYARIRSIFRKGEAVASGQSAIRNPQSAISLADPAERSLAVKLLQFPEAVATVASECLPNVLCAYLYDLAGTFTTFYETCPVLKSDEPTRSSRLALCDLTARVIRTGLDLLGIRTIEQM
ncbi:MAG: arginine--tRNA ligase [Phycisphaerae bacterium]